MLIAFAVDNPRSLSNVTAKWIPEVQWHCPGVPFMLVGLKADLRDDPNTARMLKASHREFASMETAHQVAIRFSAHCYVECSATTREGVHAVFELAAELGFASRRRKSCCCILQ